MQNGVPALSIKSNRGGVDAADQVHQTQEKGTGYVFDTIKFRIQ